MIFLVDTNVLIHALRGRPRAVADRLRSTSPDDIAISTITIAELWYGAAKSQHPERTRAAWTEVLEPYKVLAFERAAAELHGELRHALRHRPIGERDLFIAAIALAHGLTVVTHNVAEFARVPDLLVVDWART